MLEKYKMDGILTDNIEIINAIDKNILKNKGSNVIPVKINKDGNYSSNTLKKMKTEEEFSKILEDSTYIIKSKVKEIKSGKIDISPYKYGDEEPCKYCPYKQICRFDIKKNGYRNIKKEKKKKKK